MSDGLQRRLLHTKELHPSADALLNLLVAAGNLRSRLEEICAQHGVTHAQYNVLRILRGAQPDGHPRCEIARRMVERAPDVTRLVDRLEKSGLADRTRTREDRRLSLTRITPAGLQLLDQLDPEMARILEYWDARLTVAESRQLSRLCEKLYDD